MVFFPPLRDFFPPTPETYIFLAGIYRFTPLVSVLQTTRLSKYQAQGKTSFASSRFNLPGRLAWCLAELIGPLNVLFILYTLPSRLNQTRITPSNTDGNNILTATTDSFSLPPRHIFLATLYLIHYANRAVITPLFLAPSMSPIHALVAASMVLFQFVNSSVLASWLAYDAQDHWLTGHEYPSIVSGRAIFGLGLFVIGMAGNILAEGRLFTLRRAEADKKRDKTRFMNDDYDKTSGGNDTSGIGKANDSKNGTTDSTIARRRETAGTNPREVEDRKQEEENTKYQNKQNKSVYDKIYVLPPATGLFKYILYPHYTAEWLEWTGYWLLSAAWGLGSGLTFALPDPVDLDPKTSISATATAAAASSAASFDQRLPRYSGALWFVVMEISVMAPRAVHGLKWYQDRFGERAVKQRKAVVPGFL